MGRPSLTVSTAYGNPAPGSSGQASLTQPLLEPAEGQPGAAPGRSVSESAPARRSTGDSSSPGGHHHRDILLMPGGTPTTVTDPDSPNTTNRSPQFPPHYHDDEDPETPSAYRVASNVQFESRTGRALSLARSNSFHSIPSVMEVSWPASFDSTAQLIARRPPPIFPTAKIHYEEKMRSPVQKKSHTALPSFRPASRAGSAPSTPGQSTGGRSGGGKSVASSWSRASSIRGTGTRRFGTRGHEGDDTYSVSRAGSAGSDGGISRGVHGGMYSTSDPNSSSRLFSERFTQQQEEVKEQGGLRGFGTGRALPSIRSGESLHDLALEIDTLKERENKRLHQEGPVLEDEEEEEDDATKWHDHDRDELQSLAPSQAPSYAGSTATLAFFFDLSAVSDDKINQYMTEIDAIEASDVSKMTFAQSLLNNTNFMVGVGLLSCPYFMCNMGWLALLELAFFATLTMYTAVCIGWCIDLDPNIKSFPDLAHMAFGHRGRILIAIILYTELLLTLCVFLVIMGTALHSVTPGNLPPWAFVVACAVVVTPPSISKDMTIISYFSVVGLFTTMGILIGFYIVIIYNLSTERVPVGRVSDFIVAYEYIPVGTPAIMFLFSGHAIFPSIKTNMRKPELFTKNIVFTYLFTVLLVGLTSLFGFFYWGAHGSVPRNLIDVFDSDIGRYISTGAVLTIPFCKFSLCLNPVACGMEELLPARLTATVVQRRVMRVVVVVSLVVLVTTMACVVPFLDLVEGLIGALCSTSIAVIVPTACSLVLRRRTMRWFEVPLSVFILCVFSVLLVTGTVGSLRALVMAAVYGE